MLSAKTKQHRSRTLDDAIKDVKKVDEAPLMNKIPKDLHTKFKIKVAENGTNMKEVLIKLISDYVDN